MYHINIHIYSGLSQKIVLDILQGRIVPALVDIYELSNTYPSFLPAAASFHDVRLVGLLSTSSLAYILASSCGPALAELAKPIPLSINETSFVEEMLLQCAEFLNNLEYPVEVRTYKHLLI